MTNKSKFKIMFSIFLGVVTGIIMFFHLYPYPYFFLYYSTILSLIVYTAIIVFLILWNIKKSRLVYLLLIIPGLYFAGIGALIAYQEYSWYVYQIPRVAEENFPQYELYEEYDPYFPHLARSSRVARLNGESNLKLIDNLPILDGATAFYPLYASFVNAVYPLTLYSSYFEDTDSHVLLLSRTSKAYNNLLERKVDIIFCLEPSEAQIKQFEENRLNLKLVPIGREAFVFFVNVQNPVNNITIEQIQKIYSGRIKNWRRIGGLNQRIRAFQRPPDSGSQTIMEKIMGGIPLIRTKSESVIEYMESVIYEVAAYKNFNNAIGYSFLYYSSEMVKSDKIKYLSIGGIFPSKETILDNSYPFSQNIYAIYIDDKNKNENIELFIEWILSNQGQELVSETGYIPIIKY